MYRYIKDNFTVIGGKLKFQSQDSFLEYFFFEIWRFEKRIPLSEKQPPLRAYCPNIYTVPDDFIFDEATEAATEAAADTDW